MFITSWSALENHIGLEKVRNVIDGLPAEHGIKIIGKLLEQVQKEEAEKKNHNKKKQIKNDLDNRYSLTDGYLCCDEQILIEKS